MSGFQSKVEALEQLWFEPINAQVVSVLKITAVDGTITALGKDGKIYSTGVVKRVCYSNHGDEGRLSRVLDGCIKLGVLSAAAVKEHKEDVKRRNLARDKKYYANSMPEWAEKAGIKLTKSQLAKLKEQP